MDNSEGALSNTSLFKTALQFCGLFRGDINWGADHRRVQAETRTNCEPEEGTVESPVKTSGHGGTLQVILEWNSQVRGPRPDQTVARLVKRGKPPVSSLSVQQSSLPMQKPEGESSVAETLSTASSVTTVKDDVHVVMK